MTDPSRLPPEQDAVRRLLADARHDGPPPPEVVARLDETLAGLVAERGTAPLVRGGQDEGSHVVDLGARRRRLAGLGVLAAAAVVVAGVALGQALPRGGGDAGSTSAASDGEASSFAEAPTDEQGEDDAGGALTPEALKSPGATPYAGIPGLSTADPDLDQQVLALRSGAAARSQGLDSVETFGGCDLRGLGTGRRVAVQVDGVLGVVVFRRADGPTQQADVYACGDPSPLRTLQLPAP